MIPRLMKFEKSFFEKGRFVFQGKTDRFQVLAISVHEVCGAMTFSK